MALPASRPEPESGPGAPAGSSPRRAPQDPCQAREVLGIVGDKWALLIVRMLKDGPLRFTELKRSVDGISQRMLTVTLRDLERDGLLTRTVHNVMPPHVSYQLTTLGTTLREATAPLLDWSIRHLPDIDTARETYDGRQ
ncbi:winged helix-turn-helix transcriptional regulator [Microlunatus soli]|uniref:DNA-binding transcriptional regulator, HxlR family n=1 Tax=Microlunatus soli TaxID=630515 RepID=A0A1H1PVJ9_9ACTN|nr:helix-turn-helix domain-containing protein [Microlunatus soli]SDS15381.1 DNA-binding transcriptional regulator, HxlR family [Microlunatus soli]